MFGHIFEYQLIEPLFKIIAKIWAFCHLKASTRNGISQYINRKLVWE